jgi:hypothetical protein
MKYLIPLLLLAGCSSTPVPVKRSFPDAPEPLMEKCLPLVALQQDAKISDVAKNISYNYSLYHECSVKVEAWQEWYTSQKKIFDEVK